MNIALGQSDDNELRVVTLSGKVVLTLFSSVIIVGLLFGQQRALAASPITEYPAQTSHATPGSIAAGPNGNTWFTEVGPSKIGDITPSGFVTEFSIGTNNAGYITLGPDGNMWFTGASSSSQGLIGKITPTGSVTTYPTTTTYSGPGGIVIGPNGNIWFTEAFYPSVSKIGEMTPEGVMVNEFDTPTASSSPTVITVGSDGNLWFTETSSDLIGRITPTGTITEFPVLTSGAGIYGITAGSDGNIWFTEQYVNQIGKITTAGVVTEYPVTTASSWPVAITSGPDGNLWFSEVDSNKIGEMSTSGTMIAEYPIPTDYANPNFITTGADNNIWFTESGVDQIAKLVIPVAPNEPNLSFTLPVNTVKDIDTITNISGNPDPSTITIVTPPANGKATINTTTGIITETPDANYLGPDKVVFSICSLFDSSLCSQATLSFTYVAAATTTIGTTSSPSPTAILAPDTGFGSAPNPLQAIYFAGPLALMMFLFALIKRPLIIKEDVK